jgi:hypothetical protein
MKLLSGVISVCLFVIPAAFAQQPVANRDPINYDTARLERVATAVRITDEITIDGRLEEEAWNLATPATNFLQWARPGVPATNNTEARILYDDNNLYVGINMWDKDIENRVVNELREDFNFRDTDGVSVILDTLYDRRSGFLFGTNPLRYESRRSSAGRPII